MTLKRRARISRSDSCEHTILLIDDSAPVRKLLRVALEPEGYSVLEAADGREGVRPCREHRPALVIADIVMPKKDGIETVKEILAIDPAPVVFTMSGSRRRRCYALERP